MSVDLAGAGASCLCDGFGLRRFGSSPAGCLPVPRFRWLVFGSSLAGCLPVAPEGFDFDPDFDFDFDLPSAPFLISPPQLEGEIRSGADGKTKPKVKVKVKRHRASGPSGGTTEHLSLQPQGYRCRSP